MRALPAIGAVAGAAIRRLLRDRVALFFIVVLPIAVILLVGSTSRGFDSLRVGVLDKGAGTVGEALVESLESTPALDVKRYHDLGSMRDAARRGELETAVVLPEGMDDALRRGEPASVVVLADESNPTQLAGLSTVQGHIAAHGSAVQAAQFASTQNGVSFDEALAEAERLRSGIDAVGVGVEHVDADSDFLPLGFSYSAPTMLVLFVFINAMAGGAAIIENRRLGIYERMSAAPITSGTIIAGETVTYLGISLLQSTLIVLVGAVLFGVDWGAPLAALALVMVWALVATGAGMLAGTVFRTAEQASSIGPAVGIALGMLGGCMWPLAIVPPFMQAVGRLVPQGWAVEGWIEVLSRGGGLADIVVPLAVLAGFALVLLTAATFRLRQVLAA